MKILVLVGYLFLSANAFAAFDHEHKAFTQVLSKYLNAKSFFNYKQLQKDIKSKQANDYLNYLSTLSAVSQKEFNGWDKNHKMSFLINAYNAFTIKLIVDKYPTKSIRDLGGFFTKPWDIKFFSLLGGKIKSLDPIEHKYLRPVYKDFRIHAAVNCASISCPPLRHEAFVPSKLEAQLDEQMTTWVTDTTRNQVSSNPPKISKIFDWYKKDFVNWGGGVAKVFRKFLPADQKKFIKDGTSFDYLDYDWNLNEQK